MARTLKGLILMGGQSSRFGRPKGIEKSVLSPALSQCIYLQRLLSEYTDSVFFSMKKQHRDLYWDILDREGFTEEDIIYDLEHIEGPMAGLYSAMSQYHGESFFLLSVDLFFLNKETLEFLLKHRESAISNNLVSAESVEFDVHVFNYKKLQPLCAIYEASSMSFLKEAIENRQFSLYKTILGMSYNSIDIDGHEFGERHPLTNVNKESDLYV